MIKPLTQKTMTVTAEINIDSPTGRRIVRELERHNKVVKLTYPIPPEIEGIAEKTYTFDEFEKLLFKEFENRYGVDIDSV
jgi:hypothetical protein